MSIRTKTFLVVLFGLIVSLVVGFTIMHLVISDRFENIEKGTIEAKSAEQVSIINSGLKSTNLINKDWSKWDDTYKFALDGNQDFIDNNLDNAGFGVLEVNAIQVINVKRELVYYKSWNYQDDIEYLNDEELKFNLSKLVLDLNFNNIDSSIFGYFGTDNIYYFAAHQITKSVITDNSDIAGVLIFVREMDVLDLKNFGLMTPSNSTMDLLKYKEAKDTVEFDKLQSGELSKIILSKEIFDYFGDPILILRIQRDRVYTSEITTIFMALFLVLLILFSLFGLLIFFSIDRNIFSKLLLFSSFLSKLNDPLTTQERLKEPMSDEFRVLQDTINGLLDNIQKQRKEVERVNNDFRLQNEQLKARQEDLNDRNAELDSMNKAMIGREMRMIELKTQMDVLNKKVDIIDIKKPDSNQ